MCCFLSLPALPSISLSVSVPLRDAVICLALRQICVRTLTWRALSHEHPKRLHVSFPPSTPVPGPSRPPGLPAPCWPGTHPDASVVHQTEDNRVTASCFTDKCEDMCVFCARLLGSQINLIDRNIQLDWTSAFEGLKTHYTKLTSLLCLAPERFRRQRVPGGKKNTVRCGIENSLYPKPRDEMKDEGWAERWGSATTLCCLWKKEGTTKSVRGRTEKKKKKKIKWICSEESNPLILTKAEIQGHEKPLRWQAVFY